MRLRLFAVRHYAQSQLDVAPAPAQRHRGARRVAPATLQWHQQLRRLDVVMRNPARRTGLRLGWMLVQWLSEGWVSWQLRHRVAQVAAAPYRLPRRG